MAVTLVVAAFLPWEMDASGREAGQQPRSDVPVLTGPLPPLPLLKPLFDYPLRDTSICLGPDGVYYLTGTTGGRRFSATARTRPFANCPQSCRSNFRLRGKFARCWRAKVEESHAKTRRREEEIRIGFQSGAVFP